ncbi:hypothetical protein [Microbaculum marinum]|uniref:Uncharacterized protein n=1 Tax=Microbaculum marinum TaxID=1764581 RepID=A0AAW9RJW3_9HYPH
MTIDGNARAGLHEGAGHRADDDLAGEEDLLKEGARRAKEGARHAYEAATEETQRVGEFVREQAGALVERQKSGLARGVAEIARHIRKSSEGLIDQPNIEDLVMRTADQVDAAATSIERKSTGELYSDAEDLCRRYPVTVATCAVVLGALVSRSLKSPPRYER